MGARLALVSLEAIKTAGTTTQVATFDLNVAAAQAIKDGTIAMAVDAQPFAQGYEAVDSLWLFNTNGNDLGGGGAVLTGPSIVDPSNIDKVLPFAQTELARKPPYMSDARGGCGAVPTDSRLPSLNCKHRSTCDSSRS